MLAKTIFYYVIIINLIAFIVYGIDKRKAMMHQWRIPEATLLILALIGGSIGAWFGMQFFHHKTKHPECPITAGQIADKPLAPPDRHGSRFSVISYIILYLV